ncbi:MAG: asparaginase domain-containing protein [Patescibacteria group bacterium]
MINHVSVILTGGTIDSHFGPTDETIKVSRLSAVKKYLDSLQLHITLDFQQVCRKDSRAIEEGDRNEILRAAISSESKYVLITHGTYTMPETGAFLKKHNEQLKGKTVVMTGSMKPLDGFLPSDAAFNLGFALSSLLTAEPGIYISMNGKLFKPETVMKNISIGRFEEK